MKFLGCGKLFWGGLQSFDFRAGRIDFQSKGGTFVKSEMKSQTKATELRPVSPQEVTLAFVPLEPSSRATQTTKRQRQLPRAPSSPRWGGASGEAGLGRHVGLEQRCPLSEAMSSDKGPPACCLRHSAQRP